LSRIFLTHSVAYGIIMMHAVHENYLQKVDGLATAKEGVR